MSTLAYVNKVLRQVISLASFVLIAAVVNVLVAAAHLAARGDLTFAALVDSPPVAAAGIVFGMYAALAGAYWATSEPPAAAVEHATADESINA